MPDKTNTARKVLIVLAGLILIICVLLGWRTSAGKELLQYVGGEQTEAAENLVNAGADVNAADDQHETPLFVAACFGNDALVSFLLEHGANVEARDDDGDTPLIGAVRESVLRTHRHGDFPATIGTLLAYHAQVNARNSDGYSALSLAKAQRNTALVAQLERAQKP